MLPQARINQFRQYHDVVSILDDFSLNNCFGNKKFLLIEDDFQLCDGRADCDDGVRHSVCRSQSLVCVVRVCLNNAEPASCQRDRPSLNDEREDHDHKDDVEEHHIDRAGRNDWQDGQKNGNGPAQANPADEDFLPQ